MKLLYGAAEVPLTNITSGADRTSSWASNRMFCGLSSP